MAKKNDELTPLDLLLIASLADRKTVSDDMWITPHQVALLTSRSYEQVEDDRRAGTGPKWQKPYGKRGAVRYRMGAVRDFMLGQPEFDNLLDQQIALGTLSFGEFLDTAGLDDTWSFLIHQGVPVDFVKSLTLGEELKRRPPRRGAVARRVPVATQGGGRAQGEQGPYDLGRCDRRSYRRIAAGI